MTGPGRKLGFAIFDPFLERTKLVKLMRYSRACAPQVFYPESYEKREFVASDAFSEMGLTV